MRLGDTAGQKLVPFDLDPSGVILERSIHIKASVDDVIHVALLPLFAIRFKERAQG
jgi:hypothetical protein